MHARLSCIILALVAACNANANERPRLAYDFAFTSIDGDRSEQPTRNDPRTLASTIRRTLNGDIVGLLTSAERDYERRIRQVKVRSRDRRESAGKQRYAANRR